MWAQTGVWHEVFCITTCAINVDSGKSVVRTRVGRSNLRNRRRISVVFVCRADFPTTKPKPINEWFINTCLWLEGGGKLADFHSFIEAKLGLVVLWVRFLALWRGRGIYTFSRLTWLFFVVNYIVSMEEFNYVLTRLESKFKLFFNSFFCQD